MQARDGEKRNWRPHAALAGICVILFLLNAALYYPLFVSGQLPYRDSIESGYAGMARFFAENPNPWGWNPLQYGGLPARATYLPAMPYTAAAMSWISGVEPVYAHRLAAAVAGCAGPCTLFLFYWYFTRRKAWAFAAALGYTVFSPAYGLAWQIDGDRGVAYLPWRLQVLLKYGEGPHNLGLTLMPLALVALWRCGAGPYTIRLTVAACLLALIALTNWFAALAAAFACALLVLSWWPRGGGLRVRATVQAGGAAYLLACFWLTPSLIANTFLNWPKDAFNFRSTADQRLAAAALLAALLLLGWALRRVPPFLRYATLAATGFGAVSLGFYWRGVDILPESRRFTIEFEFFLACAAAECARWLTQRRGVGRILAFAALAGMAWAGRHQAFTALFQDRTPLIPFSREDAIEYRLARWVAARKPSGRVFASGGTRFRINRWFDLPQTGGVFETSVPERASFDLVYQFRTGLGSRPEDRVGDMLTHMVALGVEYVVAHGPNSREHYRDLEDASRLGEALDVAHREEDDTVYRVPFRSLAVALRAGETPAQYPGGPPDALRPHVSALLNPERAALPVTWRGNSRIEIGGAIPGGSVVSLKVNFDRGWSARQGAASVEIVRDSLGFMTLRQAGPWNEAPLVLTFGPTGEDKACAAVSLSAVLFGAGQLIVFARRRRREPKRLAAARH